MPPDTVQDAAVAKGRATPEYTPYTLRMAGQDMWYSSHNRTDRSDSAPVTSYVRASGEEPASHGFCQWGERQT